MTANEQPSQAADEDILFLAEHAHSHVASEAADASAPDGGVGPDKAREAMFILLSRLSRSFDHQRDRERAELLASVRRA